MNKFQMNGIYNDGLKDTELKSYLLSKGVLTGITRFVFFSMILFLERSNKCQKNSLK